MSKLYAALAAIALVFVLAGPGPASASEQRPDGARNLDQHEFSSHRRRYRYVRRYYGPRYYGPRYRYGYYGGYPYYGRPYYGGPGIYASPFGIGIGFGPRYWW